MASSFPGFYTTSHYITSLTYLPGYGSDLATQSQTNLTNNPSLTFLNEVNLLDFGKPTVQTQHVKKNKVTTYGASLFSSTTFTSTDAIASAVEQFIDSFVASFHSTVPYSITIAVGTTNYGSQVTKAHGQAWGNMINSINTYISNKAVTDSRYNSIQAVGANDMETGWNPPSVTRAWVDGYRSSTNYQLCNFGDAGGMPQAPMGSNTYISGTGNNGWTLDDIWYVSDGGGYSFSLPEIYTTSGTQAAEWYNLILYSKQTYPLYQPFSIYGTITENAADSTTNTPSAGWNQLAEYIYKSNDTIIQSYLANGTPFMQWSTDISWALP